MLKKILFILCLTSVSLFATQSSRVNSLTGNESIPTGTSIVSVYDATDVMIFPHLANQYTDLINVFYAGADNYSAFATFNVMPGLTIGVSDFNTSKQMWGLEGVTDLDGNPLVPSNHTYSIFGAYSLGALNFGLAVDYWASSLEAKTVEKINLNTPEIKDATVSRTANSSIFGINLSMGMDLGNKMGFDSLLSMSFGNYTNEEYNSEDPDLKTRLVNSPDAYTEITIGGRFFINITESVKLTTWAMFDYSDEGYSDIMYTADTFKKANTIEHTKSASTLNLGAAFEIKPMNKDLTVTPSFGLLIDSNETTHKTVDLAAKGSIEEDSNSMMLLPYIGISAEYSPKKWLTIYAGYFKIVTSQEIIEDELVLNTDIVTQDENTTINQDNVGSNFAVGLSVQSDSLKFIATLNKEFLLNGPNFVSGTEAPLFVNATLQWNFGHAEKKAMPEVKPAKVATKKVVEVKKEVEEDTL